MPYELKYFRTVKHGRNDINAHCRHCKESRWAGDVSAWAKRHAKKTLHTVDVYTENWTEYTSHYKDPLSKLTS